MVMARILASVAVFIISAMAQAQHWVVQQGKSEMTDERVTAIMVKADGTSDTAGAVLGIKCSSGKVDVAVYTTGTDYQPAQSGIMNLYGHWYQHPSTDVRLRFDSEKETGKLQYVLVTPNLMLAYRYGPSGKSMVRKLIGAKHL